MDEFIRMNVMICWGDEGMRKGGGFVGCVELLGVNERFRVYIIRRGGVGSVAQRLGHIASCRRMPAAGMRQAIIDIQADS
jgi:hypothetical protein